MARRSGLPERSKPRWLDLKRVAGGGCLVVGLDGFNGRLEPARAPQPLTLGTVSVAAGAIDDAGVLAVVAPFDGAAHGCGAAVLDGPPTLPYDRQDGALWGVLCGCSTLPLDSSLACPPQRNTPEFPLNSFIWETLCGIVLVASDSSGVCSPHGFRHHSARLIPLKCLRPTQGNNQEGLQGFEECCQRST